ncbi:IclR family transcriptional regulator [Crossiella cryophila]|uniref:DNA-binding IclR family transcriptional regulator n=1 Tax=Crossiella cryophila TaxID=43355 RepID=A0A7W7CCD6_9PSEU|nr:IclR family transcriptional regulator [Crossiella cryophila]MBB4676954.1 DNA-binding IclR family transcriptional regulator [Crossiella cryophila]
MPDPEPPPLPAPAGLLGSVRRALQVLEAVADFGDGVTAKAVARRLGLNLSSTYHLLNTLVYEGYLVRLNQQRGYGLGYKLTTLDRALRIQLEVCPEVSGLLREVHELAGVPAYYTVMRDNDIVVAEIADSVEAPRVEPLDVGFHEAAQGTAFGKVLLAAMSPQRRREYFAGAGMRRATERTLTALPALEEQLLEVRHTGVAAEIEEFRPELACVAAPVRDCAGRISGALAFSVPLAEFGRRRTELTEQARAGAARLGHLLALRATLG